MIHGAGHSSDESEVLDGFGTKYDASQTTKEHGRNPIPMKGSQKNKRTTLLLTMRWMNSAWLNSKR